MSSILETDLFYKALLDPTKFGNAKLYAVSGFASPTLVSRHFFEHAAIHTKTKNLLSVELIVGMGKCGGIPLNDHKAYQKLINNYDFKCHYVTSRPCVHSKVYAWYIDNQPAFGFVGSANYTQAAFDNRQGEVLQQADPVECRNYYDNLFTRSTDCVNISDNDSIVSGSRGRTQVITGPNLANSLLLGSTRTISFLARGNRLPDKSGLNWGQRPEQNREPNQAYFKIPKPDADSGFFPVNGEHFILKMDDGKIFICRLEQANNKALTTPHDNSEIGRYIRGRIGNKIGQNLIDQCILKDHLDAYGRNDIEYKKLDSHSFEGNFSI